MNARHRKTLAAILSNPVPKSLPFRDIEALLRALGCTVKEGSGSRVGFAMNGIPWTTHRPHPGNTIDAYQIKQIRVFLSAIGVKA